MKFIKIICITWISTWLLHGCSNSGPDQAGNDGSGDAQSTNAEPPTQFNGVWEVIGRTGNEDGSNEPVCGFETGIGNITIDGSKITGNVVNKSGFEYIVKGTIYNSGEIKAMLVYQGYDAAELFGTFSAETNSAKGNWKDAVNACPGVWKATRTDSTAVAKPADPDQPQESPAAAPEPTANSG